MNVNHIKYITGPGGQIIPVIIEEVVQHETEQPQCSYVAYGEDEGHNNDETGIITLDDSSHEQDEEQGNLNNAESIIADNGQAMTLQQLIECSVMEEVPTVEGHDDSQAIYVPSNYNDQQTMQKQEADGNENVDIIYEFASEPDFGTFNQFNEEGQCNAPVPTAISAAYFCPHCGNCYTAPGSLKLHMRACLRTRTEVPAKDRQCKECKKVFNSVHYLKSHMLTHVDKKHFRCQRCYRKFVDEEKFNSHTEAHEQQDKLDAAAEKIAAQYGGGKKIVKEYVCSFCSDVFMVAFDVGQVKRRYACDDCRAKYSNKEALMQHKEMINAKREFPCNRCGRKFVFEGFLQRHQPTCDGTIKRRSGGAKSHKVEDAEA